MSQNLRNFHDKILVNTVAFVTSRDPSGSTSVEHVYSVLGKNVSACFVDFYRQCKWMTISQNLRNFHDKILVNTAFQLHEGFFVIQNLIEK